MKLLVITAVQEYSKDIKAILKKSEIHTYSYKDVTGFRDLSETSLENNWFAGEMHENQSVIFYAFVEKENSDQLFNRVNEFNDQQKNLSKVHVVILNVEKSN